MKKVLGSFFLISIFTQAIFNQDKINDWLSISLRQNIGQSFVSEEKNLYKIRLFARNPQLANKDEIIFTLFENGKEIRNLKLNGLNVGWDFPLNLQFPPVDNSKGKSYYFSLSSKTNDETKVITFGYSKDDRYKFGSAFRDEKPLNGDLYFATFYKNSPVALIINETVKTITHLSYDKPFIIFYLLFLSSLLLVAKRLFTKSNS